MIAKSGHVILILVFSIAGTASILFIQEAMFFKVTNNNVTMVTIDANITHTHFTSCAILCLKMAGSCFSFIYNAATFKCVLGSWIVPDNGSTLTSTPGVDIYTTGAFCNTSANQIIWTNETVSTCIWLSSNVYNFTSAQELCKRKKMNLYTPKTLEKLNIIKAVAASRQINFWVGLDDMEVENVFRWSDDGSELDLVTRKLIFSPYQPDDHNGNEDCVSYSLTYSPLNDGPCSVTMICACERGTTESGF